MRRLLPLLALLFAACATRQADPSVPKTPVEDPPRTGILVMAHGGSPSWNLPVQDAIAPIMRETPTSIAFGMADRSSLAASLDSLRRVGVDRVAVVRLFLSGESFLDQTEFYLGIREVPPETFLLMGPHAADPDARKPILHRMSVATHRSGVLDSPEAGEIAVDRAIDLSSDERHESVLLLAHGMGDEGANSRVLSSLHFVSRELESRGFAEVRAATLREDWPEARAKAEADIRDFVKGEEESGRMVIVVPMRLSGFGPYAEVLDGLTYSPAEGFLPHDAITAWVRRTAADVACSAGWGAALGPCEND